VTTSTIRVVGMVFHSLFIGATGAGKTNTLLYWLQRLSRDRRDVALVLIDPHDDAATDLVRSIPSRGGRGSPSSTPPTSPSGNPLSLPQNVELKVRVQVLHKQVE
jgi:DNA helicase HerA-like ATPase